MIEIEKIRSGEREKFIKSYEQYKKRQDRLDKIFGWMKKIPGRFPKDIAPDDGYDWNHWKGLGPLTYIFWRTLADEGFYGMLDMLSFHYFDDRYVLTFKDIRANRRDANKWRDKE